MTIDHWIAKAAQECPNKTAIYFDDKSISYDRFHAWTLSRAKALANAGLTKGDRVAWLGLNHPDVFVLLFAAARLGLILVPLNWRLTPAELATICTDCAPKLLIHDDTFAATAQTLATPQMPAFHHSEPLPPQPDTAPQPVSTDDPLLIVYTSGSTGTPKGVVLNQTALIANAEMSIECHALTPDDRALVVLPLFHVGGLNILATPAFSIGASIELHARFDPAAALDALNRCTTAIVVPTILQAIMNQPDWAAAPLGNLRVLSIGSTDVPMGLVEAVHTRAIPLVQIYGATETAPLAIYQRPETAMATAGSIGQAGCRSTIRLVTDEQDVADGTKGEIWVKGDATLSAYWNDPAQTRDAMTNGWFKTGDVASRDANGNYYFTDRVKNVIISGGENIYPAELERVLNATPKIHEACVVGRPDPNWGEIPVAVVVSDQMSKGDVLALFHQQIARYKHPRDVVFVDSLPRNAMGKIVPDDVKALLGPN